MVPGRAQVPFRVAGGTWPAEIWRAFMVQAMDNQPCSSSPTPMTPHCERQTGRRSTLRRPLPPATATPQPAPTTATPKKDVPKDDEKDDDNGADKDDDKKDTTTTSTAPSTTESPTSTVVTIPTSTSAAGGAGSGNADPKAGENNG